MKITLSNTSDEKKLSDIDKQWVHILFIGFGVGAFSGSFATFLWFESNKKTLYTKLETALTRILKKNFMHLHPLSSMSIRVNTAFRRKTEIIRNMQSTANKRKVEVLFLLVAHMILKFSKKKNVMSTMELKRIFI